LILTILLTGWASGVAQAQKEPRSSLAETLQYIQDTLNQQGAVNVEAHVRDLATGQESIARQSYQDNDITIDPTTCQVRGHSRMVQNGTSQMDSYSLLLGQVKKIEVVPMEHIWQLLDATSSGTKRTYQADPPVSVLMLHQTDSRYQAFSFYDTGVANRVASAVAHAVELCGQSKQTARPGAAAPGTTGSASGGATWVPSRRLALVVGNSSYGRKGAASSEATWPDLEGGPIKDADAVAERLRKLGFAVVEVKNEDLDHLNANLRQLEERIRAAPDSLALFYFAGHGAQAPRAPGLDGDDNYLIPVGTNLIDERDAYSKAVSLKEVSDILHHSRAGVVILDACRNNALRRPSTRAMGSRGLRSAENMGGMLFAYSTSAGEVADNRSGEMSQYTQALVQQLGTPGESLTTAFRTVRRAMSQLRGNRLPELTDELNEDIVLVP
jgi:hypothetical protein